MTKKEIIAAFEKAEKEYMDSGYTWLCWYFGLYILNSDIENYLMPLWEKYRTRKGLFHFHTREERLEAIRKVLNDLKNEQ